MAQWIERRPANQRVASSIPSQGTCLGWRLMRGNHTLMFVSLSSTLPLSLKINEMLKKKKLEKE